MYELAEAVGGAGIKAAELLTQLLDELNNYEQELLDKGALGMAKTVNDLRQSLSKAMGQGIEFSDKMLESMLTAAQNGDIAFMRMVQGMLDDLYVLKVNGSEQFDDLWLAFKAAMEAMDMAQFNILQGMLNNVGIIITAVGTMQRSIDTANKTITHSTNGLVTREDTSFSEGGVIDYTGPAAVHGSKSHPEVVFNADAAAKLYNYVVNTPDLLKSAFAGITADSSMLKGASQINNAPSIGDININISGNADADTVLKFKQLAGQLRDEVVKSLNDSMNRRGIMRSPRVI